MSSYINADLSILIPYRTKGGLIRVDKIGRVTYLGSRFVSRRGPSIGLPLT